MVKSVSHAFAPFFYHSQSASFSGVLCTTKIATSIDLPDLQSQAASREEAIADLESKIKKRLITTEIVTLSLPIMPKSNPWLDIFGKYAADPDFDQMLFHIETDRKLYVDGIVGSKTRQALGLPDPMGS